jgi:hypothetical protein
MIPNHAGIERRCKGCGVTFVPTVLSQYYCCIRCYNVYYARLPRGSKRTAPVQRHGEGGVRAWMLDRIAALTARADQGLPLFPARRRDREEADDLDATTREEG